MSACHDVGYVPYISHADKEDQRYEKQQAQEPQRIHTAKEVDQAAFLFSTGVLRNSHSKSSLYNQSLTELRNIKIGLEDDTLC